MVLECERKRVLLAARPSDSLELLATFSRPALKEWELVVAENFERARFTMQHTHCDAVVVDEGLYHATGSVGLDWLTQHRDVHAIFLGGMEPAAMAEAYTHGATICLPRHAALSHPELLEAALARAAGLAQAVRAAQRVKEGFHQCRRQVDRLVNLLWRTAPIDSQKHWFTQRHLLERVQEEVSRCGRHGATFTIALGEVHTLDDHVDQADDLADWTADVLFKTKRRCDVAGSYGLKGFVLLMVQTPATGGVVCCRRLQNIIGEAARQLRGRCAARAYFGLSSFRKESTTLQALLSMAEKNLAAAQAGAGDGVVADLAD
jgi:diguanylate cyclase (GGDEF)-like protein